MGKKRYIPEEIIKHLRTFEIAQAAGGASNAASQVTQWYLKHAQSLTPPIAIGSGQDVWIVIQDTVALPRWYFKKGKETNNDGFSYLSRFLDH